MYLIEKTFKIPMGHRLSMHKGLCQNFHGHNFVIKVGVSSKALYPGDMVVDFSVLKDVVNGVLIQFDHAMVINGNEVMEVREKFKDFKLVQIDGEPTAENLSRFFYEAIKAVLGVGLTLEYVKIWENEDSMAMYKPEVY